MTAVQHQNLRSDEQSAVYAWIITHDHTDPNPASNAEGISGPVTAPGGLLEALDTPGLGHRFRLYDDDGTLYYSGLAAWDAEGEGSEDVCYAPLGEFGCGYAGATEVRWDGHPEWDCG